MSDSASDPPLSSGFSLARRLRRTPGRRLPFDDRLRYGLLWLLFFWLLLVVLLPLFSVVKRAVFVELPVRIEEPTAAEIKEDNFRGQISIAGRSVMLISENRRPYLYIDNQAVSVLRERAEGPGIEVEISGERLRRVACKEVAATSTLRSRLQIAPLVVELSDSGRWLVDGRPLPAGDQVMLVERFIGLLNFFDYFGFVKLSQWRIIILLSGLGIGFTLLLRLLLYVPALRPPLSRQDFLLLAVVIILLAQLLAGWDYLEAHLQDSGLAQSVWNSLRVALTTTAFAVSLAFFYAYGIQRTCMRGKSFYRLAAMLPLFAPTMLYGLSLVYLFGNKGVVTTGFFEKLPQLGFNIGLYGFKGIVIAETAYTFPAAFMILLTALANTDARYYEAAQSLGAGSWRIFRTVTLPSIKYGLLSSVFVCFTLSFTDFGAPKVVGGQFNVLAVDIYKQVIGQQNFSMGATVSVILLLPTLLAFIADRLLQRRASAGVSSQSRLLEPKPRAWRDQSFFWGNALIAGFIVLMVFMAGLASLVRLWPYSFTNPVSGASLWTLKHYAFAGVGGGGYQAFFNSVRIAFLTAVFGTVITFVGAYLVDKGSGAVGLRRLNYLLSVIPLALPGLVIGIAYIFFFNCPGFALPLVSWRLPNPFVFLYGSAALIVICNIVHFYTVSFLTATTALRQLDREFEEVSAALAVPFYKTFYRVTLPVCLPAMLEIAAYYFISSMATVSAVIFLYTSDLPLASVAVVNMDDAGDTAAAAAMCMLIVITNIVLRGALEGVAGRLRRRTQAWRRRRA